MNPLPNDPEARKARALLSLEGLSVGDAFGERFFERPGVAEAMIQNRSLPRAPWAWTDDTQMAVSIVEALSRRGGIEQDELALAFARRFEPRRGYAGGASRILRGIQDGGDWRTLAQGTFGGQGSLGNGGAMRAAPLGAFFADDLDAVTEEARKSAEVTHAHPDGQAGAVAAAMAAALMLRDGGKSLPELLTAVADATPAGATREGILRAAALPESTSTSQAASVLGTGRQVSASDTVPFALWCAFRYRDSYEEALWQTVGGLGDRDTTCAIAGGVVSLRARVPAEWIASREPLPPLT